MRGWCSYISSFCIKMTQNTPSFVIDDSQKINDVGGTDLHFLKDSEKVHGCVWDGEQLTSSSIHCILTSIWKIVCETTINDSYFVTWPHHCMFNSLTLFQMNQQSLTHWFSDIMTTIDFLFLLGNSGRTWRNTDNSSGSSRIVLRLRLLFWVSNTLSSVEAYKWFRVSVTLNFLIHMKWRK